MATQFHFDKHDNHIIADIGGRKALIDTGSPRTMGSEFLPFAGQKYPAAGTFMGTSLSTISTEVGTQLDWLVGADTLSNYRIELDWRTQTLTAYEDEVIVGGMSIDFVVGIPVLTIDLNGIPVRMFFDTGAKISYARRELINSVPVTATTHDFYPGLGPFETPIRNIVASIAGRETKFTVGQLPTQLEATLLAAGVQGIIGNDLFETYPRITIDYPNKKFSL